jgi:hypothetical protein
MRSGETRSFLAETIALKLFVHKFCYCYNKDLQLILAGGPDVTKEKHGAAGAREMTDSI